MKNHLLSICLMLSAPAMFAGNIYVDAKAGDNGDGSKAAPFNSLSTAIATAQPGDEILMTQGRYLPEKLEDVRRSTFKLASEISIVGGYNSDFSAVVGKSLLSADFDGNDVYDEATGLLLSGYEENATRVITVPSGSKVTLKNLILQGGYADMTDAKLDTGGGMYIGSPVTMENCEVTGNFCKNSAGGGGLCVKGDLTANNCIFRGNFGSGDGGALYIKGDINVSVTNCSFFTNKSTSGAGIFFNNARSCFFAGNTFEGNMSETYGTFTVYNKSFANTVTLVNNTLVNNTVSGNVTGKTLLGGAGVYVYTAAAGKVNMINNTVIGNSVIGQNADLTPSAQLGGAVYSRQGTLLLSGNVIAGNYSLSGFGDLYKHDTGVLDSREYNFYTSYDNMNVTPERNDIVAGLDRASGLDKMLLVFDGETVDGNVKARCSNNGGFTNTVKIISSSVDFEGLTIASLPTANLSETSLGVDVDNNGEVNGSLSVDQRGAKRKASNAFIGAYEEDPSFSTVVNDIITDSFEIHIADGKIVFPGMIVEYTVYNMGGSICAQGVANSEVSLSNLSKGLYFVKLDNGSQVKGIKIVL